MLPPASLRRPAPLSLRIPLPFSLIMLPPASPTKPDPRSLTSPGMLGSSEGGVLTGISVLAFRTEPLYTPPPPLVPAFGSFHPARLRWPGEGASSASFRYEKRPHGLRCKRFLRHLAVPPSFLPPVSFPAAPSYSVGREIG